jgi:hypothetical protein
MMHTSVATTVATRCHSFPFWRKLIYDVTRDRTYATDAIKHVTSVKPRFRVIGAENEKRNIVSLF